MKIRSIIILLLLSNSLVYSQILNHSWKQLIHTKSDDWYSSDEAKKIAENVLLYQRDIGGWPKNVQMQMPISASQKRHLKNLKQQAEGSTTDNGATAQEMLFLSKIYAQTQDKKYKYAFLQGLEYLLAAQYSNGGWPQFYPVPDGYYSHITYNDDSMVNIMRILKHIKDNSGYYSIKPSVEVIKRTQIAFDKGVDCILRTQYVQNGVLTSWCAQHDENTLMPAKARAYELPSLSGKESAQIVLLLMDIENPTPEIINSIESAVTWFDNVKILGLRQDRKYNKDGKIIEKIMVSDPNAPVLWARFMDLEDNTPFFSDRDGIKKPALSDIGDERRNGYAWYTTDPQEVLDRYPNWKSRIIEQSKLSDANKESYKVVAQDGSGDYMTIQEAINDSKSFPYERITIYIKNGIYKEKVKIHEWNTNITLFGESKENTRITFDDYFEKIGLGRNSTFFTSTLLVEANDVIAKNLTIENSAGEVGQAVAVSVNSDRVMFINCQLLGNQDTLYTSDEGRHFFKDCYIEGTTDFIFGGATAYFENCEIHSKKDSYITAASTPKDAEFGFVFKNCTLTAEQGIQKVYLGRPWRIYAKTVFIDCVLGDFIMPDGWDDWSKPEAHNSTFYAEFNNKGEGYKPGSRVDWSFQLSEEEAKKYTKQVILQDTTKTSTLKWYEEI